MLIMMEDWLGAAGGGTLSGRHISLYGIVHLMVMW